MNNGDARPVAEAVAAQLGIDAGELETPGISEFGTKNFAQPVISNGGVDIGTLAITGHPAVKFPAGTSVFAAHVGTTTPDHPSTICRALQP